MTFPPDDVLIRRAQRGDAAALEDVARAVLPRLHRWAVTLVASADDADDIAQATLISATRGLPRFDFRARLDTWLYRILRREVTDHHRRTQSRRRLNDRLAARPSAAASPHVSDPDSVRAVRLVHAAYRRLPARQRETFDLVDLQGMTPSEAAVLLGLAAPTVRVHLLRARRALRTTMIETAPALVEDRIGLPDRT